MDGGNQPSTQPRASTTQPTQCCPLKDAKPCAVDGLSVSVVAFDDDDATLGEGGKRKKISMYLQALKKLRDVEVKGKDGKPIKKDFLGAYDLVFEAIADYNSVETPRGYGNAEDLVTIENVHASFTTPDCPRDEHALLKMVAKTACPEIKQKEIILHREGVNNLKIPEDKKFLAPGNMFDLGTLGAGPFVVFEWITTLWNSTKPKEIEIIAFGCGRRAKDDTRPATTELKALVRIHRRDNFVIGVKIPPLGSYKTEHKTDGSSESTLAYGVPGMRNETKTETNRNAGGLSTNSKGTRDLVEKQVSLSQRGPGTEKGEERINRFGDAERGRRFRSKQVDERLSKVHGFDVVIARNDREIGLEDLISSSREIGQGAKKAYQNRGLALQQLKQSVSSFAAAIESIKDLWNKVPKWGFYFTFDLKVFAGTLSFEWGPGYVDGPLGGRYYPVATQYKGKIAMEIVNLTLTLGFGFSFQAGGKTGIKASIEGTLTFKAAVNKTFSGNEEEGKYINIESECTGKLGPIFEVQILGWTLTRAEASVSSGLQLKGGALIIDKKTNKLGFRGTIISKPVVCTASFRGPFFWQKYEMEPKVLLESANIYQFK